MLIALPTKSHIKAPRQSAIIFHDDLDYLWQRIEVKSTAIQLYQNNADNFISLTDIARYRDAERSVQCRRYGSIISREQMANY